MATVTGTGFTIHWPGLKYRFPETFKSGDLANFSSLMSLYNIHGLMHSLTSRFLILLGLVVLLSVGSLTACNPGKKAQLAELAADAPDQASVPQGKTLNRAQYQKDAEQKLTTLSTQVEELKKISAPALPLVRSTLQKNVEKLEAHRQTAQDKLLQLQLAPDSGWMSFKQEMDTVLYELETLYIETLAATQPSGASGRPAPKEARRKGADS